MKNCLLTYDESQEIVNANAEMCFFETKHNMYGYDISIFLYKLAWYDNFSNPLLNKPHITANEMRGTTFVFSEDGSLFKRYLMLPKFWNINQIEEVQYNNIKDLKIKQVQTKEDGSLIRFIKLPNGKIIPKTKGSFSAPEQLELVEEILATNGNIIKLVEHSLDNDIALFFELVSFKNKIVLDYANTDLILLKARCEKTGDYIDIEQFDNFGVKKAPKHDLSLDDILALVPTAVGIEGWCIQFIKDDGEIVECKIKTEWYRNMHKLLTQSLERENDIIKMILNETIDDLISEVPIDQVEKLNFVNNIINKINNYLSKTYHDVNEFYRIHCIEECNSDKKEFSLKYLKHPLFSFSTALLNNKDLLERIKKQLLKDTYRYKKAKQFIENLSID